MGSGFLRMSRGIVSRCFVENFLLGIIGLVGGLGSKERSWDDCDESICADEIFFTCIVERHLGSRVACMLGKNSVR